MANDGVRENLGKPPVSLILSRALLEVAKVSEFGAKKYEPHNYRKGMKWSFFIDAAMRHLIKYTIGERIDEESGLSHLSHIAWNILALLEYEVEGLGTDDLFKGYKKEETLDFTKLSFFIPEGSNITDAINNGEAYVIPSCLIVGDKK
jgi:hypothetical protein